MEYKENFTAILPVTCNANCSFCPEKEMENKASKDEWVTNLLETLIRTRFFHNHVSLSGGEPTLDPRLLARTIKTISRFRMGVGITTNGQFLESLTKTQAFMDACRIDGMDGFYPYFINISRHAFDTVENNRLMETNYRHDMNDIFAFRRMIPRNISFRLNMVLVAGEDHLKLFKEALAYEQKLADHKIVLSFRTDYNLVVSKEEGLIPKSIYDQFVSVFGVCEETYSCPTCVTHSPQMYSNYILKAGDFEPTTKEELEREFVFHQDGKLYNDWKRNRPVARETIQTLAEEAHRERVSLYGMTLQDLQWGLSWITEEGQKKLCEVLEVYNAKSAAEERPYRGPSCGSGGCGSGGPSDDDVPVDTIVGDCGGSPPPPGRSQSNCGGVNAFPERDPGPAWTGCSGERKPRC